MKTFKNRNWRKIVIWDQQQSVEAISDDIIYKILQSSYNASGSWIIHYNDLLDFTVNTWSPLTNQSTRIPHVPILPDTNLNRIEIVTPWIFEIEFAYWITDINSLHAIRFAIEKNWIAIIQDKHERVNVVTWGSFSAPSTLSLTNWNPETIVTWYRKQFIKLEKWDLLDFIMNVDYLWSWSLTLDKDYTYRSIHYLKSNR